jgi:hypothetical protein
MNSCAIQPASDRQSEWGKRPEDVVPLALFLATQLAAPHRLEIIPGATHLI